MVGLQDLNALRWGCLAGRERRKQHSSNYRPWLSFPEWQALASCDRNTSVNEFPIITQPFLFLRPRVSIKASSNSSLLDISENSNRRVEAVDQDPVSLLWLFVRPPLFVYSEGSMGSFSERVVHLLAAPSGQQVLG